MMCSTNTILMSRFNIYPVTSKKVNKRIHSFAKLVATPYSQECTGNANKSGQMNDPHML